MHIHCFEVWMTTIFQGFYHMENTSTKSAEAIRSEVARVLGELVSNSLIKKVNNPKRFVNCIFLNHVC